MAQIIPFRALRYNTQRVEPEHVLTQPYDKITPEMQQRYQAVSAYNLITVEKGVAHSGDSAADNVYTRAASALDGWIAEGVLVEDARPSLYVYGQLFLAPGTNEQRSRQGLIALGHLEDYSAGVVFRHEQTLSAPKADRLQLLRHTRAQTGQLFLLYDDPQRRVDAMLEEATTAEPAMELVDEFGVEHRLWRIDHARTISKLQSTLADARLVIADGHHRYETALAYRNERRATAEHANPKAPWEYAMMTLVNARSPGLIVLPTHRIVFGLERFALEALAARLAPFFEVRSLWLSPGAARASEAQAALAQSSEHTIGVYAGGDALWLLVLKPKAELAAALPTVSVGQRELDVVLLHGLILEQGLGIRAEDVRGERSIRYERDGGAAIAEVDQGRAQAAFLLKPVAVGQVMDLALAGEVLPQKSTDFYPKLLSGMTLYRLPP
jgi:uncharacterized protein (DUF1015 family)